MAATYGVVNVLSSFGFCKLWRKQCVRHIKHWSEGATVVDMMSGMGELWQRILKRTDATSSVTAIDISPVMCHRAMRHQQQNSAVDIIQADILAKELTAVADVVVSSFGLKTFSQSQQVQLAKTLRRILKPGRYFVVSEISVPPSTFLRWPYLFYLRHVIPFMGRLFLRISTEGFGDASRFARAASRKGWRNHTTNTSFALRRRSAAAHRSSFGESSLGRCGAEPIKPVARRLSPTRSRTP